MFVLLLAFDCFSRTVLDPGLSPQTFINCCYSTLFARFYLCVSYPDLQAFFFCPNPILFYSLRAQFCFTVATIFCSSWDEYPAHLWILRTFCEPSNMSRNDLATPVTAAATAQVKLCPYDEENLTSGSASSRLSLQRQGSDHKNSNTPML